MPTPGSVVLQTRFWQIDAEAQGPPRANDGPLSAAEVIGLLPAGLQPFVRSVTMTGVHKPSAPDVPCVTHILTPGLAVGAQGPVRIEARLAYGLSLADLLATWAPICGLQTTYAKLDVLEFQIEPDTDFREPDTACSPPEPSTSYPTPESPAPLPRTRHYRLAMTCGGLGRIPQIMHVALERRAGVEDRPHLPRVTNSVLSALLPAQVLEEIRPHPGLLHDITALLDIVGTPTRRSEREVGDYLRVCRAVEAFAEGNSLLHTFTWVRFWLLLEVRRASQGSTVPSEIEQARLAALASFRKGLPAPSAAAPGPASLKGLAPAAVPETPAASRGLLALVVVHLALLVTACGPGLIGWTPLYRALGAAWSALLLLVVLGGALGRPMPRPALAAALQILAALQDLPLLATLFGAFCAAPPPRIVHMLFTAAAALLTAALALPSGPGSPGRRLLPLLAPAGIACMMHRLTTPPRTMASLLADPAAAPWAPAAILLGTACLGALVTALMDKRAAAQVQVPPARRRTRASRCLHPT